MPVVAGGAGGAGASEAFVVAGGHVAVTGGSAVVAGGPDAVGGCPAPEFPLDRVLFLHCRDAKTMHPTMTDNARAAERPTMM